MVHLLVIVLQEVMNPLVLMLNALDTVHGDHQIGVEELKEDVTSAETLITWHEIAHRVMMQVEIEGRVNGIHVREHVITVEKRDIFPETALVREMKEVTDEVVIEEVVEAVTEAVIVIIDDHVIIVNLQWRRDGLQHLLQSSMNR